MWSKTARLITSKVLFYKYYQMRNMNLVGIYHALASVNNTLWTHPCLSVCVSVAFLLGRRQPAWPEVIFAQQREPIVSVNHIIVIPNYCGGTKYLWNVGKLLPDYTAQHPRRQPSMYGLVCDPNSLYNPQCTMTCSSLWLSNAWSEYHKYPDTCFGNFHWPATLPWPATKWQKDWFSE
jgi:hypothetical protein